MNQNKNSRMEKPKKNGVCWFHLSRILTLATVGIIVPDQNTNVINLLKSLSNIKNFLSDEYKCTEKFFK